MATGEIIDTRRKALAINLNKQIYGTFAEIGAGQEVARNFFTVGAASNTIAKTMSAYDMTFSDAIYGAEGTGRYVSRKRLQQMLVHEYELLTERLHGEKYNNRSFFAFADTVTTLNYKRTNDPHGWMGIKFQTSAGAEPNEIIFHVRLKDADVAMQQRVLGIIGVNLVYGAYFLNYDIKKLVESLTDDVLPGSVEFDYIWAGGPNLADADPIMLNMYLIPKGYATASIFDTALQAWQPKDLLFGKDVIILRTKYNQRSLPNFEMLNNAVTHFKLKGNISDDNIVVLLEVLLSDPLDNRPLKDEDLTQAAGRIKELAGTGNYVLVSNFNRHTGLVKFFENTALKSLGMTTNVNNLKYVFSSENFDDNYGGFLLNYVNDMFAKNVRLLVYPYLDKNTGEVITTANMPVQENTRPLLDYLVANGYITDVVNYANSDVKELKG